MADTASDIPRRINAERILIIGWLRAILLQLAHPLIAAGVAEHSTFRGGTRPALFRLHQTIAAMLAISFGTAGQRQTAIDGIRAIHRRVHGRLPNACGPFAAGTNYSAEDSDLLLWVHATLVESILLAYEQLVAPLAPAERDRYCAESADVAVALGADPDAVPQSWNAMRALLARGYASGDIVVGDQARALAASLVTPFRGWIGRRLLTPILSVVAAGQLPAPIRSQYGFAWSMGRERTFLGMIALFRATRRILPRRFAWWRAARCRAFGGTRRGAGNSFANSSVYIAREGRAKSTSRTAGS
jgi:uncharacterized protein (DUF2236 family)